MRGKNFCQLAPLGESEREENVLVKTAENISATRHHPSRGLRQPRRRSTLLATVTQVVWSRDTESGLVWSWIVQLHPDHKLINLIERIKRKFLWGNRCENSAANLSQGKMGHSAMWPPFSLTFSRSFEDALPWQITNDNPISYYDFWLSRAAE